MKVSLPADVVRLLTIAAQAELGPERAKRFIAGGLAALAGPGAKPEARGLGQADVARLLGCSRWSVRRMVTAGKLTPIKLLGGLTRFDRNEVETLLAGGSK